MPDPDLTTDPFTQIYEALWTALVGRPAFTALVATGNRINYTGIYSRVMKDTLQPGDAPQVRIMPGGGSARQTSTGWIGPSRYTIEVFSGSMRLDEYYFPLKWELYKAFWVIQTQRDPLGLEFVSRLSVEDISEDFVDVDVSGGSQGWYGLFSIVVDIGLSREMLEE